jgi:hypothetical protein
VLVGALLWRAPVAPGHARTDKRRRMRVNGGPHRPTTVSSSRLDEAHGGALSGGSYPHRRQRPSAVEHTSPAAAGWTQVDSPSARPVGISRPACTVPPTGEAPLPAWTEVSSSQCKPEDASSKRSSVATLLVASIKASTIVACGPQVARGPCSRKLSMCGDRLRSQGSPNELAGLRECCPRQDARILDEGHCLVSDPVHQYHRINGASECFLEDCPLNHTRSPFSQTPTGSKLGSCFPLRDLTRDFS